MKVSFKSLRKYLFIRECSAEMLAKQLTMVGFESNIISDSNNTYHRTLIGEVISFTKSFNDNKLYICQVDVGKSKDLISICDINNNIHLGMKLVVVEIDYNFSEVLSVNKVTLHEKYLYGLFCSQKFLGISDYSDNFIELSLDAPVGSDFLHYLYNNDSNNVVFNIELPFNRSDCLSIYGIAREISFLICNNLNDFCTGNLKPLCADTNNANIVNSKPLINYFTCCIQSIDVHSRIPCHIQDILNNCNINYSSISLLNIINYLLIELGQPFNVFDADKVEGSIKIRYAVPGEKILLGDDRILSLDSDILVSADSKKVLSVVGVFISPLVSVTNKTKNIVFESLSVSANYVTKTVNKYDLDSEFSSLFERGVDHSLTFKAFNYSVNVIIDLLGGSTNTNFVNYSSTGCIKRTIILNIDKFKRVLGIVLYSCIIESLIEQLGFLVVKINHDNLFVNIPFHRFDVTLEEDLIEEVCRLYGYDNIQGYLPSGMYTDSMQQTDVSLPIKDVKNTLLNRGYNEVINYSFISSELNNFFFKHAPSVITLQNPISSNMSIMRQGLLPGIIMSFKYNLNRQQSRIRLFEEGVCFRYINNKVREDRCLAGLVYGNVNPLGWQSNEQVNFYHVKSDIQSILTQHFHDSVHIFKACKDISWLHHGQSSYIYQDNKKIGVMGLLNTNVLNFMNIKTNTFVIIFELFFKKFLKPKSPKYKKISKFPFIIRDMSFIVDDTLSVQSLIDIIFAINIQHLTKIDIFDVYQGANLGVNKKSVGLKFFFEDHVKTITDIQANILINTIVNSLKSNFSIDIRVH